jgi:class 3 adenylate cyclase/HAMP domain-containing protein
MLRNVGIRGRLLFSFLGISMFSVLAAGAALFSFIEVGKVLDRVSKIEAPDAIVALEISRQAERMVGAAPLMLSATTIGRLDQIRNQIVADGKRLDRLMVRLRNNRDEGTFLGTLDWEILSTIDWNLTQIRSNLAKINELVGRRIMLNQSRRDTLNEFRKAHANVQTHLSSSITELDLKIEIARATSGASSGSADAKPALGPQLLALLASRESLQTAQGHLSTIHGILLETQLAEQPEVISNLSFRWQFALGALESHTDSLGQTFADSLIPQISKLQNTLEGTSEIFTRLTAETAASAKAREALIDISLVSEEMSAAVDQLVAGAKTKITGAIAQATLVQRVSTWAILAIVLLSLICSILIVWLYVGRNIIARLIELSVCMESVAGGDLKVDLPSGGTDEIGRMTSALTVFRDTAVEIEENNLREIGQARQRLIDAIEAISEGFCIFDSHDRLIIANNRYRALMYPGAEDTVVEGISFEKLIRHSAENGYIMEAKGRIDEWVTERLQRHRHPGEPQVQQRGDGRWIMISERRTGDGSTVAVYSDITELKLREEELTDKSNSMEQLSNQIAKYLSPQVYESIFTGKREVKVASRRRKLTVFFSDIVGFTETADKMESEDLTKLLNHYLSEMSEIALAHGATIDKYVGDAIVIFFGDPETRGVKEDALACVKMAIAMRTKMTELRIAWRDSGIEKPLQIRIGINTGYCTVGNFGSDARMDYTIIGSGVNLAARLETAATPGQIMISFEAYALVKDEIRCEKLGEIKVKGIAYPVETYQVMESYEDLGREREYISEDRPNFTLKIDLEEMSADEQRQAAETLKYALKRLKDTKKSVREMEVAGG